MKEIKLAVALQAKGSAKAALAELRILSKGDGVKLKNLTEIFLDEFLQRLEVEISLEDFHSVVEQLKSELPGSRAGPPIVLSVTQGVCSVCGHSSSVHYRQEESKWGIQVLCKDCPEREKRKEFCFIGE